MKCSVGQMVAVEGNGLCQVIERTGKTPPIVLTVRRSDGCEFDVAEHCVMEPSLAAVSDEMARRLK